MFKFFSKIKLYISSFNKFASTVCKAFKALLGTAIRPMKNFFNDKRNRGLKRRIIIMIPCFIFSVAVIVTTSLTDYTYAYSVMIDGEKIGYVESQATVEKALELFNQKINDSASDIDPNIEYSVAVKSGVDLSDSADIYDSLVTLDNGFTEACGVYIDNRLVAYAKTEQDANDYLNSFLSDDPEMNSHFLNNFNLKEEIYSEKTLKSLPVITELGNVSDYALFKYNWKENDTFSSVAKRFNSTEALLDVINSNKNPDVGDEIQILGVYPVLTVCTATTISFTSAIEYETVKKNDSSLPVGETSVISKGCDGKKTTVEKTVSIGSEIIYKEVISETITTEPVNETIAVGTKIASVKSVGESGFCWPVDSKSNNYISAYYGDNRNHCGIDIAAYTGTDILAAKGGTVVSINSSGSGYGQHFVIDHGDGIKTLYAHCSKLYVTKGQKVKRGEVVAAVGSTGRSTGPHLHFEVWVNGSKVNPASYLGL